MNQKQLRQRNMNDPAKMGKDQQRKILRGVEMQRPVRARWWEPQRNNAPFPGRRSLRKSDTNSGEDHVKRRSRPGIRQISQEGADGHKTMLKP